VDKDVRLTICKPYDMLMFGTETSPSD